MPDDGTDDHRADARDRGDDLLFRLEPLVRSVVARFRRDPAAADELMQACRIRIYEKREHCCDPEAVFGWAETLCRRVCLTAAASERRDRDVLAADEHGIASAETSAPDPLSAVETGERRMRMRSALRRLPTEQRRLLRLRYWDGLGAADIARRVGLPAATVRTRLRRARLRLRSAPEIVCYAPRQPPLWSRRPGND